MLTACPQLPSSRIPKCLENLLYTQGKHTGTVPAPAERQAALGLKRTGCISLEGEEELDRRRRSCPESRKGLR